MKVEFSPMAQDDLVEIAVYIVQDNPARALSYIDELEAKCYALGDTPRIGAPRPELANALRMVPHGRYLVFYRERNAILRIERVLHAARDISSDDFELDV